MTLEELAAKFRGPAQRVVGGVLVFCPSHDDEANRSLSLSAGDDGRLLVHCFAGCPSENVLAAVGMSFRDLAAPAHGNGDGHTIGAIAATYDYTDGTGALLYQVVRFAPKRFVQRRPDGRGGWIWSLGEVRRVPYRLPELVEQARVFWCEGEKDAARVASLGLPATTAAGGANSWRDDYAQQLATLGVREVVILPDNDPPGQAYAAAVARGCAAAGLEARILPLPGLASKQDVSDWLDAGHTREELEVLITSGAEPPATEPTPEPALLGIGAGTFVAQTFPPSESYVEGILSSDGGGWIGGEEKAGKSFYALEEALCLALGLSVCGRFAVPRPLRVGFFEEEDGPRRMHMRLRALLRGHDLDPDEAAVRETLDHQLLVSVWQGLSLDDPAMLARLEATVAAWKLEVVYLDVLRKLTTRDLNKADQAGQLLAALDALRRRYGVLFRILHHFRKQQGFRTGRGSQELGGSYQLGAWGECSLFFEPVGRKQGAVRVEVQTKDGPPVPAFRLTIQSEGPHYAPRLVRLTVEDDQGGEDVDELVFAALATLPKMDALAGKPGVPREAVIAALKRSDRTVRRAIGRLEDAGRILVTGHLTRQKILYGVTE